MKVSELIAALEEYRDDQDVRILVVQRRCSIQQYVRGTVEHDNLVYLVPGSDEKYAPHEVVDLAEYC